LLFLQRFASLTSLRKSNPDFSPCLPTTTSGFIYAGINKNLLFRLYRTQSQVNRKLWISAEQALEYCRNRLLNGVYKTDSEITFLPWRAMLCTFRVQDLALILASNTHTYWGIFLKPA